MLYVGVDIHKAESQLTVMDESGKVVKRTRVKSTRDGLSQALSRYRQPLKSVIEAGNNWGPIYDWLEELSAEVVLAHPAQVKAIANARIKTDKIDSETLAFLLKGDLIPAAYAPSKDVRAIKRVLRQRLFLVRVRTMVKNRIHALLSQHSHSLPEVKDLFGKVGMAWLSEVELPSPDRQLLDEDLRLLSELRPGIERTEGLIRDLSRGDPAVVWLSSLPGIGDFFSVLLRYEVDDIHRFHSAKHFASYTGLIPSTYSSGARTFHGKLTKQGNKWLRWALVEAVTPAVRSSPWLRRYYEKRKRRLGSNKARTATARKLAELVWTIWTEGRCYEER